MAVNLPVQNYFRRVQGPTQWVRPVDWPVITDAAGEVQFLMSDLGDATCSLRTNFTRASGSQNMVIDWGDGTTTTITTTGLSITNKTYTAGTGTPCSLGYTTFKIRVYFTGTGVSTITLCQITPLYISGNSFSTQNCTVLEVYYGDGTSTTSVPFFYAAQGASASFGFYNNLTYVKLPATVSWTDLTNMFSGCIGIKKIIMPTSAASLTSLANLCLNCYNLEEIIFPSNATSITNFSNSFQSCVNLQRVILPSSLNNVSTFAGAFGGATNLKNITLPSINVAASFSATFSGCVQLEWARFTSMPTVTIITFASAFINCYNLQNIYFPATGTSTSIYDFTQTFSNCQQLKSVVFPSNINANTFSQTFASCTSLISCIMPTNVNSCVTFANAFQNCFSLTKVTLPNTAATGVSFATTFNTCYRLESITIPSTIIIGSLSATFSGCSGLKTINLPANTQNNITSLAQAFNNCRNLEVITLPTTMNSANNLGNTFTNCSNLRTVTFPATMNAITTIAGIFNGCTNLTSVTLPTSMSSCNAFNSAFQSCKSLRSITFPNTVSSTTTTFANAFSDCNALQTVVLPGAAQLINVNTIDGMFNGCSNLTTVTNFDKIGSLAATPLIGGSNNTYARFTSISFVGPYSILWLNGPPSTGGRTDVQSVRLLNTSAGQWTGSSPQINVSYTNMSTANLVQLFNDMAAQPNVVSKTINITGAVGAAGLTAADRLIVTSKGWTITG